MVGVLAAEVVEQVTTAHQIKGVIAFLVAITVFIGSVWLLLSLVLGPRLGYWLMGSIVFGILMILSIIWFGSVLGPKGPITTWVAIGAGPELKQVKELGKTYDLSAYPDGGGWEMPKAGRELVKGAADTESESEAAKPVLDTFVSQAVSVIPGVREKEKDRLAGSVDLVPQKFSITDVRMKEAEVDGKPSLLAVGKAVPSDKIVADLGGAKEGEITDVLVNVGDTVKTGQPVLDVKTASGSVKVNSTRDGKVAAVALVKGDSIKPGVPFATLDISGQPGQPAPVEVAAARVRGAARTPSLYYLAFSLVLFAFHLRGLSKAERAMKAQTATA